MYHLLFHNPPSAQDTRQCCQPTSSSPATPRLSSCYPSLSFAFAFRHEGAGEVSVQVTPPCLNPCPHTQVPDPLERWLLLCLLPSFLLSTQSLSRMLWRQAGPSYMKLQQRHLLRPALPHSRRAPRHVRRSWVCIRAYFSRLLRSYCVTAALLLRKTTMHVRRSWVFHQITASMHTPAYLEET